MPPANPVATKIMIIRHGEKPLTDGAPYGVTEDGTQDAEDLLVRGWTRAGALAALFAPARGPLQSRALATPEHLFACKPEASSSRRPYDTIAPLARRLGIAIDDSYGQDDYEAMIEAAKGQAGPVLICWEHKRIRKITARLPREGQMPPDKYKWPGDRFDVVFVFDLHGDRYRFTQVPELLLAGDSPDPIDVLTEPEPEDEG